VGVPSSIAAGGPPPAPEPWALAAENHSGRHRLPAYPSTPAATTIAGKGTLNARIETNAAAAMPQSAGFLSAREPMRYAAKMTMAVTAGLMP
jgi:hypothetical protein